MLRFILVRIQAQKIYLHSFGFRVRKLREKSQENEADNINERIGLEIIIIIIIMDIWRGGCGGGSKLEPMNG